MKSTSHSYDSVMKDLSMFDGQIGELMSKNKSRKQAFVNMLARAISQAKSDSATPESIRQK